MRIDEVKQLYAFDQWSNERLWLAVLDLSEDQLNADMSNGIGGIQRTLLHMVNGAWTWRIRWEGGMPAQALRAEDFPTLQSVRSRWQEEEEERQCFLETLQDSDLDRELRYMRPSAPGQMTTMLLWTSMLHVINHQTQHRSEIAMQLTHLGHSPGELGMTQFFAH